MSYFQIVWWLVPLEAIAVLVFVKDNYRFMLFPIAQAHAFWVASALIRYYTSNRSWGTFGSELQQYSLELMLCAALLLVFALTLFGVIRTKWVAFGVSAAVFAYYLWTIGWFVGTSIFLYYYINLFETLLYALLVLAYPAMLACFALSLKKESKQYA